MNAPTMDEWQDDTGRHKAGVSSLKISHTDCAQERIAPYPWSASTSERTATEIPGWYLIRTKTGGERTAQQLLQRVVERTLLPLGKMQVRQRARSFQRIAPIFPCYLFAYFRLGNASRQIRYTPGVRDLVRFGDQAATVPDWVIHELASRCAEGPADLSNPGFSQGAPLQVVCGPFREFQAVFDGYISGTERVAVLLSVMNAERRIVMPARMVTAAT